VADALKVIDALKKTIADLTVQNAALSVDLEETVAKLDLATIKLAEQEKPKEK